MVASTAQLPAHATPDATLLTSSPLPVKPVASLATLVGEVVVGLLPSKLQLEAALRRAQELHELSAPGIVTLFRCAIENGSTELLAVLLSLRLYNEIRSELTEEQLLRMAVGEGDAQLTETVLNHFNTTMDDDNNLQLEDPAQRPLLLEAVEQDNEELVRVLLQCGRGRIAGANARDEELRWTALHSSVEWNSVAVETLLVQAGASIDAQNIDGWTPLHLAVHHGHCEAAELLLRAGASVDLGDATGATPLHVAARDGHTQLIALLLQSEAQIEVRDADGRTPLHVAAFYDESAARFACGESDTQVAVVKLLLRYGADATACDNRGLSVLQAARFGCFDVIVELLTAHQRRTL